MFPLYLSVVFIFMYPLYLAWCNSRIYLYVLLVFIFLFPQVINSMYSLHFSLCIPCIYLYVFLAFICMYSLYSSLCIPCIYLFFSMYSWYLSLYLPGIYLYEFLIFITFYSWNGSIFLTVFILMYPCYLFLCIPDISKCPWYYIKLYDWTENISYILFRWEKNKSINSIYNMSLEVSSMISMYPWYLALWSLCIPGI